MAEDTKQQPNIAETLSKVLPKAEQIGWEGELRIFAVPPGWNVKELDIEKTLAAPLRPRATAEFATTESFLAYVKRHADEHTVCWCDFDPQTFALSFKAVIDDYAPRGVPAWRQHSASYIPDTSAEWKAWKGADKTPFSQVAFAEWIQEHDDDITAANGLPTSLQMLDMATNFVMNEERSLKSAIRLQSGGTRLTYIADPDSGTVAAMELFERFGLGIPVFHNGPAWSIGARLKYRNNGGKLSFFYELVRPDRVHESAARELIKAVGDGLGSVPLLMGKCRL